MRNNVFAVARISVLFGLIYTLAFPVNAFAKERYICGMVSKAEVSPDSGDMLRFVIKEGKKNNNLSIYIEDEAVKSSALIWDSFHKKKNIYIILDDNNIRKIQNSCP